MGRLLQASQVRAWIRGEPDEEPEIPTKESIDRVLGSGRFFWHGRSILNPFRPSLASVLTISAPQLLLSASLYSFLIGLGVYVSFVWRRQLDPKAGFNDSRNIFITYVVSIAVCEIIYSISAMTQEEVKAGNRLNTVFNNWKKHVYARILPEHPGLQTKRQENPIGSEKSRQFSLSHPSNSAQSDNIQGFTGQRDEVVSQNQLPAPATTEMRQPPVPAAGSGVHEPETAKFLQGHTALSGATPQHHILIKALQDSARLRRETARLEEVIARCYEQLLENHQAAETTN